MPDGCCQNDYGSDEEREAPAHQSPRSASQGVAPASEIIKRQPLDASGGFLRASYVRVLASSAVLTLTFSGAGFIGWPNLLKSEARC